jgi:hypothetical protein
MYLTNRLTVQALQEFRGEWRSRAPPFVGRAQGETLRQLAFSK